MLKKIIHIILSTFLLISTMGVVISKHYCGARLVSVSLFSEAESCSDMIDFCCHDEMNFIQVDEDFSKMPVLEIPNLIELDLFGIETTLNISNFEAEKENQPLALKNSPRPLKIQTVLSENQAYLL